jgi:hypothetical protein
MAALLHGITICHLSEKRDGMVTNYAELSFTIFFGIKLDNNDTTKGFPISFKFLMNGSSNS